MAGAWPHSPHCNAHVLARLSTDGNVYSRCRRCGARPATPHIVINNVFIAHSLERLVQDAHAAIETSRQRMQRMQIKNSEADMDGMAVSPPLAVRTGVAPSHVWAPAVPCNRLS